MRRLLILTGSLLIAAYCFAQTMDSSNEIIIAPANAIKKTVAQRHPSSDLVLRILNYNRDKKPVLIEYKEDKETSLYVKELNESLAETGLKVSVQVQQVPLPTQTGRYNNCTYEITDTVFMVRAYPAIP